ncbi:hypothetical protein D9M68_594100 [compost metagenome]
MGHGAGQMFQRRLAGAIDAEVLRVRLRGKRANIDDASAQLPVDKPASEGRRHQQCGFRVHVEYPVEHLRVHVEQRRAPADARIVHKRP